MLLTLTREMKVKTAWLIISVIVGGCSIQQPRPYPDTQSLLNAPPPQTRRELSQQCNYLRQEIALQRTKESTAAITLPGTTLLSIQDEALQNIAALTKKYKKLGCDDISNEPEPPTTPQEIGNYIDICMEKCKQYTDRTPEQCFDSCKQPPKMR